MALFDYFTLLVNVLMFSLCVLKLWRTIKTKSPKPDLDDSQETGDSSFDGSQLTFSHLREKERESATIHTSQNDIIFVCVTGGPCAGKSSVIAKIMSLARTHDIQVYYQPDVNMTMRNGGFTLPINQMNDSQKIGYVSVLIKLQMKVENIFFSLARASQKKALILVERGTLDYKPLLTKELWQGLLDENGWKEISLSNTRYHMVIHLETAARGAAEIFNKWNDGVWTVDTAMDMDLQLKEVWKNHHHFRALRNMKGLRDFENKVDESVKDILTFVNPSTYRQHKRKFLVECDSPETWGLEDFGKDMIETVILKPANADQSGIEKVECMTERSGDTFYIQKISINPDPTSSQKITAHRNLLTPKEYLAKMTRADKEISHKVRYSFIYKTNHYALTKYKGKREWVLRVLTRDQEEAVQMPQFVRVIRHLQDKEKVDVESLHNEEERVIVEVQDRRADEKSDESSDGEKPVGDDTHQEEEKVASS